MRALGTSQRCALEFLVQFKGWHEHGGWTWSTPSATRRIMEALEKRGLARVKMFKWCQDDVYGYVATAKGKKEAKA